MNKELKKTNMNSEESGQELEGRLDQIENKLDLISLRYGAFSSHHSDGEINLNELFMALWKGKLIIVTVTVLFAALSIFYALSLPNMYKATALLAPASNSQSSTFTRMAGQLGGLASLAGINLGASDSSDKTVAAIELIKSWNFIELFIEKNEIAPEVFAVERWIKSSDQLVFDSSIYDSATSTWTRKADEKKGEMAEPSSWELFETFRDYLSVSQDKDTGLVTVGIEYYSPEIAARWVTDIVSDINSYIGLKDEKEAKQSIAYLEQKIDQTSNAEMQAVFYQLVEEQTKTLMLANVSSEYVFKTLRVAKAPAIKSKPRRALIVIFGAMLGGILGVLGVLARYFIRKDNSEG